MPELPEVQALVDFLTERAVGHAVARVDVASINVLKTFDPPVTALQGLQVTGASRHGKFLDSGLHLVTHLSRAGWLHWRDELPPVPPKPGKGPIALRVHLDDKSGFDLTEAGTQKKLAAYVVRSPEDVPGVARLGPDPLATEFSVDDLRAILGADRSQIKGLLRDQAKLAGIGNAYSDDILHAARLSPFKPASNLTDDEVQTLYDAIRSVLGDAVDRARGHAAAELKAEKKLGMRVHGRSGQPCPVCGDTVRSVSTPRSTTARPARPAASRSPTGGCPAC